MQVYDACFYLKSQNNKILFYLHKDSTFQYRSSVIVYNYMSKLTKGTTRYARNERSFKNEWDSINAVFLCNLTLAYKAYYSLKAKTANFCHTFIMGQLYNRFQASLVTNLINNKWDRLKLEFHESEVY